MMTAGRKMEQFCATMADNLHIGVMAAHIDGTICYMNPTFAKMFGFDRAEAVGADICNYFPDSELLKVMRSRKKQVRILFQYKGVKAFISRYPVLDGKSCIGGYVETYFRDIQELQSLLARIDHLEEKASYLEKRAKATLPQAAFTFRDLVGDSEPMRKLKRQGMRFAASSQPVLITGESGTGKELIANAVHSASPRANHIFVSVNCAAIPAELMEAELFGYEGGAFTGARKHGHIGKFELADGGTIFLDEIAEMPLNVQAKLLRVLENREIQKIGGNEKIFSDFRVVAATNKNLRKMVREGKFREDLYHRLSVLHLHSPALRERFEDLPHLIQNILRQISIQEHCAMPYVDNNILNILKRYNFPGNIRELKNILIYTYFSSEGKWDVITDKNLPHHLFDTEKYTYNMKNIGDFRIKRNNFIKMTIENALLKCNGNKSMTARELGISRNELYKKIKKFNINHVERTW